MSQPSVRIETFIEPTFQENGYVVYCRTGGSCWVLDPGLPPQAEKIVDFITAHRLSVEAIILTHGHGDHIAGVPTVRRARPGVPVWIGQGDAHMLADPTENLSASFGVPLAIGAEPDPHLVPDRTLSLCGSAWRVLDTSGHTPGSRSLYCEQAEVVIVGDALFAGSIGRTDLPHSDPDRLVAGIRRHLLSLPSPTRVLAGHGPPTTIGFERKWNPFVADE